MKSSYVRATAVVVVVAQKSKRIAAGEEVLLVTRNVPSGVFHLCMYEKNVPAHGISTPYAQSSPVAVLKWREVVKAAGTA